jgi:5,10-methylenetetrahydromethanopterin reductase
MQVGFFFWPFSPDLVTRMAQAAERYGYDMIGIADTPGNAIDPWVAMVLAARSVERPRIALCVGNLTTRHPATTAAAIASIDLIAPERAVLGIGTGHSSPRNLGIPVSPAGDLEEGRHFLRALLTGPPASYRGGEAHLPWITRPSPVFLAASGPKALAIAGRAADGAFINFGLLEENLAHSEAAVASSATASGRDPGDVELWQIAALDCQPDAGTARGKIGAILGFMAGGYILRSADLAERGVPEHLQPAIRELRRRYSTRPGAADAALVSELGLFDYLADRFAIFGTPDDCRAQLLRAQQAGLERVMFTVSLASDPLATVELFGREVLPAFH